jgi:hypothetical protein
MQGIAMKCSVDGCDKDASKRGMCVAHYSLFYRLGTLNDLAKEPGRGSYDRIRKCSGVAECGKKHLAQGFCSACYQGKRNSGELDKKPPVNSGNQCSVDGCEKDAKTKGFCIAHYEKFLKYGDPLAYAPRRTGGPCKVAGCDGISIARGMCRACYSYWQTHGEGASRFVALAKRQSDRVDDQGYVQSYAPEHPNARKSKRVPKHRLVMSEFLGRPLKANENVHHINGNKSDNNLDNLELWVTTQPKGQRPQDLIKYAKRILRTYAADGKKLEKIGQNRQNQ